jgi:Protein of unknown function (DUF4238)
MATNKNQHFVPRCYLRAFTSRKENREINLFNIDRKKIIRCASVRNQCSGDYFYGDDLAIERALQSVEGPYAETLREFTSPGYRLSESHSLQLKRFWLLQHMRTEAMSRRAVLMSAELGESIGGESDNYRVEVKQAVQHAMHTFVSAINSVDDLKCCLVRNRTSVSFIASDDPAVLTNRWHLNSAKTKGDAFGLTGSGAMIFLPLAPDLIFIGYDGDVYKVPERNGYITVTKEADILAFNEHQILNCNANIYFGNEHCTRESEAEFLRVTSRRSQI